MRHILLKAGSVLICLCILLGSAAMAAESEGHVREGFFDGLGFPLSASGNTAGLLSTAEDTKAAKAAILAALEGVKPSVNLRSYSLTCREAAALHMEVVYSHPELFYVNSACGYTYIEDGDTAPLDCAAVELNYRVATEEMPGATYAAYAADASVLVEKKKAIEAEAAHILASIDSAKMCQAEKALAVHDWFALHFAYDTPASQSAYPLAAHRIDGLFLEKEAVCQGYMLGYKYILEMLGVDAVCVTSKEMGHGWNMVEIDGAWYHVDVTHDDATNGAGEDIFGRVLHRNFLRSDAGITATNHYGWIPCEPVGIVAEKEYDGFWRDIVDEDGEVKSSVNGGVFYANGTWYYLRDNTIVCCRDGEETPLKNLEEYRWYVPGGYYGAYAGCRIGVYDGRLYYNTPTEIRSINLENASDRLEYKPQLAENTWVYGVRIEEGLLYYGTAVGADSKRTIHDPLHMAVHFRVQKWADRIEIIMMDHPEPGSMLHVAAYKGNTLCFLKPVSVTDALEYTVPVQETDGMTYKIFLWHSLLPAADAAKIDA